MKQQFVKNRRSGEFGYRLDTETGDAGGDGFDSVVGVKKTCKVELFKFSINIQTVYGFHISISTFPDGMGGFVSNGRNRKPPFNEDL